MPRRHETHTPLDLTYNDRFRFRGLHGCRSACHLRLYRSASKAVAIATEPEDNPGTSVTNACEQLAQQVCEHFAIDPETLTWVEHYPERGAYGTPSFVDEEYDLVTFETVSPLPAHPEWHFVPRAYAEHLIGQRLDDIEELQRAA
jgi:hypothetical protein